MRIFIAGCARSGTVLTRDLMGCFADLYYHPKEANLTKFDELGSRASNLVVKRTFRCYQKLPDLPDGIELLYCVRHPYDVLTSSHPQTVHLRRFHVTPERWLGEYLALKELRRRQPGRSIFFSKYENLIREPDVIQHKIAHFFGLVPARRFSEDPKNPIRDSSLHKWERRLDFRLYLGSLPPIFISRVRDFCLEFGYDLPEFG